MFDFEGAFMRFVRSLPDAKVLDEGGYESTADYLLCEGEIVSDLEFVDELCAERKVVIYGEVVLNELLDRFPDRD